MMSNQTQQFKSFYKNRIVYSPAKIAKETIYDKDGAYQFHMPKKAVLPLCLLRVFSVFAPPQITVWMLFILPPFDSKIYNILLTWAVLILFFLMDRLLHYLFFRKLRNPRT